MALIEEMESQGTYLFKYRSYLPLIFLIGGISVLVYQIKNGDFNIEVQSSLKLVALAVGLLGLFVRVMTVGHTPANTSGRNTTEGQVAEQLNTTGAYNIVRHPLYVGNFLMWLAIALLSHDFWFCVSFVLVYYLYYERIMMAEERFLIKKFGDSYQEWSQIVPAFVPNNLNWSKPKYPFSIKKVLKKEKNGLFALGLLIYIMHLIEQYTLGNNIVEGHWTLCLAGTTGVIYLILKILKRNSILDEEGR